jgi:hypothetical protein
VEGPAGRPTAKPSPPRLRRFEPELLEDAAELLGLVRRANPPGERPLHASEVQYRVERGFSHPGAIEAGTTDDVERVAGQARIAEDEFGSHGCLHAGGAFQWPGHMSHERRVRPGCCPGIETPYLNSLAWWCSFTRHGGYRRFDLAENRQSEFPAGSRNRASRQSHGWSVGTVSN